MPRPTLRERERAIQIVYHNYYLTNDKLGLFLIDNICKTFYCNIDFWVSRLNIIVNTKL